MIRINETLFRIKYLAKFNVKTIHYLVAPLGEALKNAL